MIKKVMLVLLMLLSLYSLSYADEGVFGKCYDTDIKAYINNQYIGSININSEEYVNIEELRNYNFDVRWNEALREYSVVYNNNVKYKQNILSISAQPLMHIQEKTWYDEWIVETDPIYTYAYPHGKKVRAVCGTNNRTITFKFAKDMDPTYISEKYIPIYYEDQMNISRYFTYKYTPEEKMLQVTLNSTDFLSKSYLPLHIYFMKGLRAKNGDELKMPLFYSTSIDNLDADMKKSTGYIGECYKTDITAVVNRHDSKVYRYKDNYYIPLKNISKLTWDSKDRTVKAEVDDYWLYGYAKTIYKGRYKDWIISTKPTMYEKYSERNNRIVAIENREGSVQIKFGKDILPEYINTNYIKIWHGNSYDSERFNYKYDEESRTLELEIVDKNLEVSYGGYLFDNNRVVGMDNMVGRNFDIYILEGLMSRDGSRLEESLRITSGIYWLDIEDK